MEIKYSLLILLVLCSTGLSKAQSDDSVNPTKTDPFAGTISYSIFWDGPNTALWTKQIPDSMTLTIFDGNIKVQVFGGVSDSLLNEYIWIWESGEFFLIDHHNLTVYSNPQDIGQVILNEKDLASDENTLEIMGYTCKAYRLPEKENPDTYWLSSQLILTHAKLSDSAHKPPFIDSELKLIPLRMERNVNGVQMVSVATRIKSGAKPIAPPAGYAEKPFFKHAARHPYFHKRSK